MKCGTVAVTVVLSASEFPPLEDTPWDLGKIGKFAQLQAGKQALALAREVRDLDIIGEALQAQ